MRPKTLLALFLLVAALGAFIWFVERDLPGTDERAQLEKRVVAVEPEEITELIIERPGARAHLVRPAADAAPAAGSEAGADEDDPARVKREWRLLEPHDTRADTAAADRLASSLSTLEKQRTLDDADPEAVGLDQPRATVTVKTADSETTLRVGAEIPASSNMIVAAGDQTFVVADSIWSTLATEPGEWRSRELFPLHRGAVESVELSTPEASVELVRRDDRFWIAAPLEDLADAERVDQLLDAMFRVEVAQFFDPPEIPAEDTGLAPAPGRLSVALTGREQPIVVELGAPLAEDADQRYARIDGQLVSIGDDLDEAIERAPADWQATGWTALEVYEIDSLRVVDVVGELLLERAGADWARNGVKISYGPVSDFLYALTGAAGDRVLARDEAQGLGADLDRPRLTIELAGSESEESLALYDSGSGAIAGRADRRFLLALASGTVDDLLLKLQAIRDQEPLTDEVAEEEG